MSTEGIHIMGGEDAPVEGDGPNRSGYTFGAKPIDPSHTDCLAKHVTDQATGGTRYWAKRCTGGANAGDLYDPQTVERHELRRVDNGRARYELVSLSEPSFREYISFLKTGNKARLRMAQRCD